MNIRLQDYKGGLRIISLALDEETKEDLRMDEIDFLFVQGDSIYLFPSEVEYVAKHEDIEKLQSCNNYDVFELWENGSLKRCYDDSSLDNYFFVTGKCNSNCIMCPSPDIARKNAELPDVDRLVEIARHIPTDAKHLTITGGEPFIAGEQLFEFLQFCKQKYEETEFLILTNGRIFAIQKYVDLLCETMPNRTILGIPIHGSNSAEHDRITRANGSFLQTINGIKRLLKRGVVVELRMVVCRLNIDDYMDMAHIIVKEIPGINHISIMAAEMTGNAYVNRDKVWIPYREAFKKISKAIMYLLNNEIDIKIYNFPLCTVDKEYWALCEKSISPNKVKYADVCIECKYKEACGGVFAGTYLLERNELQTIL